MERDVDVSLVEAETKESEIARLHAVIDTQLFGPRADAVRSLQVKIRIMSECLDSLDHMALSIKARDEINACKKQLGMLDHGPEMTMDLAEISNDGRRTDL